MSRRIAPHLLLGTSIALTHPFALQAQWCPALGPELLPPSSTASATINTSGETADALLLSGTVFQMDGRTPALGVIIYAYHTNSRGIYGHDANATGLAALHGRLRAWVITGADGRFSIRTIRPASYPGNAEAQHVHLEVLPTGGVACEIDAVEFNDDPVLTPQRRASRPGYGGSGIVTPTRGRDGVWRATRDIRLWNPLRADTLELVPGASRIEWTGTKFGGRGKHAGTIQVSPGALIYGGAALLTGSIVMPLASIEITDIPAWEPVPRQRLRSHLLNADFFDADRFPTATLRITGAVRTQPGTLRVQALLTVRDSTRPIVFDARLDRGPEAGIAAIAYFRINRHLWGVDYRGSQLGNDLVDDDITFRIRLVAARRRR
jgi:protocatechuate 3,4-dioxygenase, beta subunit